MIAKSIRDVVCIPLCLLNLLVMQIPSVYERYIVPRVYEHTNAELQVIGLSI